MEVKVCQSVRPCYVQQDKGNTKALFYGWFNQAWTVEAILVGTVPGQIKRVFGLVEYEDGTCQKVQVEQIKFLDSELFFNDYCWDKVE